MTDHGSEQRTDEKENISDIEHIKKIVLKIILAENYLSYKHACQSMSTVSLEERRQQLALKFALSCLKSKQHMHFLKQRTSKYYELRNIKSFEEPYCHTSRYYSSPIPAMTRLLNNYFNNKANNTKFIKLLINNEL